MKTEAEWVGILTSLGVRASRAAEWAPHFAEAVTPSAFSSGAREIDDFVATVVHETGRLEHMEENLRYSAQGLANTWPARFAAVSADGDRIVGEDGKPVPGELARAIAGDPVKIASRVYGGRMGNDQPGDAWAYRGSGPIMVTGKANFAALERITGLPLVKNPDLLRRPGVEALQVAIAWWEGNVPDSIIDNVRLVRRRVNGGEIGLADVQRLQSGADRADGSSDGALA